MGTAPRCTTGTSNVPSELERAEDRRARRGTRPRGRAARRRAGTRVEITAVVSVADDGGSSGRLRRDLGVAAPGDLRKCLVALAGRRRTVAGRVRAPLRERRARGPRARQPAHRRARRVARRPRRARSTRPAGCSAPSAGCCRPRSTPSRSKADIGGEAVVGPGRGRVAGGRRRVGRTGCSVVPADAAGDARGARGDRRTPTRSCWRPDRSTRACSAVLCVPEIRAAVGQHGRAGSSRSRNLCADDETAGLDGTDQLRVLLDHGVRVDVLLYDPQHGLAVSETDVRELGVVPVAAAIAAADGRAHDPGKIGDCARRSAVVQARRGRGRTWRRGWLYESASTGSVGSAGPSRGPSSPGASRRRSSWSRSTTRSATRTRWRSCSSTTPSGGTLAERGEGRRQRLLDRRQRRSRSSRCASPPRSRGATTASTS